MNDMDSVNKQATIKKEETLMRVMKIYIKKSKIFFETEIKSYDIGKYSNCDSYGSLDVAVDFF